MNAWLHCMRERGIELKRTIIVDVLINAHNTIMACPESLVTHMAQQPGCGGLALLQVRPLLPSPPSHAPSPLSKFSCAPSLARSCKSTRMCLSLTPSLHLAGLLSVA